MTVSLKVIDEKVIGGYVCLCSISQAVCVLRAMYACKNHPMCKASVAIVLLLTNVSVKCRRRIDCINYLLYYILCITSCFHIQVVFRNMLWHCLKLLDDVIHDHKSAFMFFDS